MAKPEEIKAARAFIILERLVDSSMLSDWEMDIAADGLEIIEQLTTIDSCVLAAEAIRHRKIHGEWPEEFYDREGNYKLNQADDWVTEQMEKGMA